MSNVTVYLFLLENIPGFDNVLTSTLLNFTGDNISQCDPVASRITWEHYINNKKYDTLDTITSNYNLGNSENEIYNEKYEEHKEINVFNRNKEINNYNNKYLKRPPFLVAIFESFFNITAQTCAGCLISSQYVLTTSSCLGLLTNTLKNSTDTQKTTYTVIANANNPLTDGTVHNVTEVILNKNYMSYLKKSVLNDPKKLQRGLSNLALMKIEPAVKIKPTEIFKNKIKYGINVRVYGWTTLKDLSGQDIMEAVSFGAKVVDNKKCLISNYYIYEKYIICLMSESKKYLNQISSGGPVVVHDRGTTQLLSVAEIRGTFVLAYSLKPHYNWIYNTMH